MVIAVVVYALYVWVIVSIAALLVQGVRRLRYDRAHRAPIHTGLEPEAPPAKPAIPVEPAVPIKPATPIEPAVPIKPATPIEPAEPIKPATPIEPAVPIEPERTLSDAISGLRLPCDLVPAIDQGQTADDRRVSLLTNSADPATVGGAVADELERLGFDVAAEADDEAVATRDDDVIGLRIIPNAASAELNGVRRFLEATEATVALEMWLHD